MQRSSSGAVITYSRESSFVPSRLSAPGAAADWQSGVISSTLTSLLPGYMAVGLVDRVRVALAGRYDVEGELGSGGMAFVYAARDLQNECPVAIKVLRPEIAEALGPERFLREIRIERRLQHAHILPLLHSDTADGLLYYVMPYVAGETLRDRLQRENQLPVAEALHIAGQVAAALDYAHQEGVIHRDIKPENILLAGDTAYVVDFGIARAAGAAGGEWHSTSGTSVWRTSTGVVVGTQGYMSPEQATAADQIDGRSDQYSLACVLYEMLAGETPYSGASLQALVAKMLSLPVPSVRVVRERVPGVLDEALQRGLAKTPADRFRTCGEFVKALGREATLVEQILQVVGSRPVVGTVTAVAAVTVVILLTVSSNHGPGATDPDTTRYAIFPPEREPGVMPFNEDQLLQDAFARWTGIDVVDPFQVKDALARLQGRALRGQDAQRLARELGAGRYVRAEVSRVGDSIRFHAQLYDTKRNTRLREGAWKIPGDLAPAENAVESLSDQLLFGSAGPGARLEGPTVTTSFPAREEFARGLDSIYTWNLSAADSAFMAAAEYDPQYSQAHLWLAQVRFWNDTVTATWRSSAERAAAGRAHLPNRDRLISDALLAFGRGDLVTACAAWEELTRREQYDFTGWYGLATCLSQDEEVVRDPRSPSGWRFRSSYYRATKAYERAFQLLPSIHRALSASSYAAVRRLLKTNGSSTRRGRLIGPDTTSFVAYPSWLSDTLAFVPFPQHKISDPGVVPPDIALAVHHQRELFRDITTAWAAAFPQSAEALEAQAISYDMLEDSTAIARIRRARDLAKTDDQRVRLAATEAWMRVMLAAPMDSAALIPARALTDSLLTHAVAQITPQALLLASLASLTGREQLAATLARSPVAAADFDVPSYLAQDALPLLVFAAFGGPGDSLRALEQQVVSTIDERFEASIRQEARMRWLVRPARIAFPDYQFTSLPGLVSTGDYLIGAEAALLRADTAAVLRVFKQVREVRRFTPPSDLNLEGLYPEARLLNAVRDPLGAIQWLDGRLRALPATDPESFANPANAAALVRSMALRADLAEQVGDRANSRRWARVVMLLWSDSDAFLQPIVRRMRQLARAT